jgi:hypothetical protein
VISFFILDNAHKQVSFAVRSAILPVLDLLAALFQ